MELALICSFGLAVSFFIYLGYRLSLVNSDSLNPNSELLVRSSEVFAYSFAGLLVTIAMFVTMEFTSAATYGSVVRTVFVILQIVLGLVSGLGASVAGISVVVLGLIGLFRGGGRNARK